MVGVGVVGGYILFGIVFGCLVFVVRWVWVHCIVYGVEGVFVDLDAVFVVAVQVDFVGLVEFR